MLFKRTKIETHQLKRGMFVAQLDRPWLETPFLFQGFEVREDSELALLRKYCQHVYVDLTRSSIAAEKVLAARENRDPIVSVTRTRERVSEPTTVAGRLMRAVTRLDPTGFLAGQLDSRQAYRNQVPTKKEAPQAVLAYDAAVDTMNEVLVSIRNGAPVEVEKVGTAVKPIIDSVLRNQDAMAWLVVLRRRDEYSYHHSIATSVWAVILGRHLGFDRDGLNTLAVGGMLLDIGKAKLPEALAAREDKYTLEQHELMKTHVELGLEMARKAPGISGDVLSMIEGHHERADGSGYPRGLKGADIPVYARIAGLVDTYDAITSRRGYAQVKSPYDAIRELNSLAGVKFQQEMVEQFVQAIGLFPTGSVVELNTGEIGIVIEQNRIRRLRPKVLLVLDADKQPLAEPRTLDLRKVPANPREPRALWITQGHEASVFGLDPKNYFIG